MPKKVFLASDHAGFELKSAIGVFLQERGFTIDDLGPATYDIEDDYPDTIAPLARAVAAEPGSFGIVFGASGQGEAIVCNRVKGVRAAVYYGPASAKATDGQGQSLDILKLSREHNDANVLSLGARFLSQADAKDAVLLWLNTAASTEERHARRVKKIDEGY